MTLRVAVIDDWQNVARSSADWRELQRRAEVVFFDKPFGDRAALVAAVRDFDVLIPMRERTRFPAEVIAALPRLRMIAVTGLRIWTLDIEACTARGIVVSNTGAQSSGAATAELALGLMLAAVRHIPHGHASIQGGGFQSGVAAGAVLEGKTLGVIGLGKIGSRLARYGRALGMRVLAWSSNLTPERAAELGAEFAPKSDLLSQSDVVTLHLVLSDRSRGTIGAAELAMMKPGAVLVNTSRGPLIDETALLARLASGDLVAALDVFDQEPLPPEHPLRRAPNTVLTPHVGYCTPESYAQFYRESIENILAFLAGQPIRLLNPTVVPRPRGAAPPGEHSS